MIHKSHLGVYALIFNDNRDAILVIKKSRGPYTGRYDLPGGTIEEGELLEETLVREILEETGCIVISYDQLVTLSTHFDYTDKEGHQSRLRHIGIIYQATINGQPISHGDGHDSSGCIWLPLLECNDIITTAPLLNMAVNFISAC